MIIITLRMVIKWHTPQYRIAFAVVKQWLKTPLDSMEEICTSFQPVACLVDFSNRYEFKYIN